MSIAPPIREYVHENHDICWSCGNSRRRVGNSVARHPQRQRHDDILAMSRRHLMLGSENVILECAAMHAGELHLSIVPRSSGMHQDENNRARRLFDEGRHGYPLHTAATAHLLVRRRLYYPSRRLPDAGGLLVRDREYPGLCKWLGHKRRCVRQ